LSADDDEGKVIAQANSEMDTNGNLIGKVAVRKSDQLLNVHHLKLTTWMYLLSKLFPSLRG